MSSGMILGLFLYLFTSFVLSVRGESAKTVTSCLSGGNSKVLCVCDPSEMIHIISVLYQTATDNCQTVDGQCQLLQESSQEGLIPRCNGQQVCNETVSDFKVKQQCGNFTALFVTFTYECIAEHPINFCEETQFVSAIFCLSTPEYGSYSFGISPQQRCECDVTGTNMTVEILEMQFDYNQSNKDDLTLTADNSSWSSVSHVLVYNQVVLNNSDHLKLEYEAKGKSRQIMWIRIKASHNSTVSCNMMLNKKSSTSALTTTTESSLTAADVFSSSGNSRVSHNVLASSTSKTMYSSTLDDNNSSNRVVIGVLSGVVGVLVLTTAALLFYFLYIKPRRTSTGATDNVSATPGRDDVRDSSERGAIDLNLATSDYTDINMESWRDNQLDNSAQNYAHLSTYMNEPTEHSYGVLR